MQNEIETVRKSINDMEIRKADKREFVDFKTKLSTSMDSKPEISEIQTLINNLTSD